MTVDQNLSSYQSTFREKIVEHQFITDLMVHEWRMQASQIDILRPEIDRCGYDLVVSRKSVVRYIQIKSSIFGGATQSQNVHTNLLTKPDGCIVWVVTKSDLTLHSYIVAIPIVGQALGTNGLIVAKHTKGNAQGVKLARPNIRVIPKSKFTACPSMPALFDLLFPSSQN